MHPVARETLTLLGLWTTVGNQAAWTSARVFANQGTNTSVTSDEDLQEMFSYWPIFAQTGQWGSDLGRYVTTQTFRGTDAALSWIGAENPPLPNVDLSQYFDAQALAEHGLYQSEAIAVGLIGIAAAYATRKAIQYRGAILSAVMVGMGKGLEAVGDGMSEAGATLDEMRDGFPDKKKK